MNGSVIIRVCAVQLLGMSCAAALEFSEWQSESPRDEIRPVFETEDDGRLRIRADDREGLNGWYATSTAVTGGQHYRFRIQRRTTGLSPEEQRRTAVVRIL